MIQELDPINIDGLPTDQEYNLGILTPRFCYGTLQQVLMSGTWAGDACFDQAYLDILTSDFSILTFSNNKVFWEGQVIPTSDATYQIQGNQIIISYYDIDLNQNCSLRWNVTNYTNNEITFNSPTSSDYCDNTGGNLSCVPHLVKQ